ncbi:minor tail protein [Gordonia phage Schiebs]|nr:minor tail protein [Gordonia phage Schiebs]
MPGSTPNFGLTYPLTTDPIYQGAAQLKAAMERADTVLKSFQTYIHGIPAGPEGPVGPAGPVGPVGPEGPVGPAGPVGPIGAGLNLDGQVPTYADLPALGPADVGAQYAAGGLLYVFEGAWPPEAEGIPLVGPAGPVGPVGPEGPAGPEGPVGPAGPAGEVTAAALDARLGGLTFRSSTTAPAAGTPASTITFVTTA